MDFFGLRRSQARRDEKAMHEKFRNRELRAVVVSSSSPGADKMLLLGIKCLFQKQLSRMPKEYILRQVFDTKHVNMALVNSAEEIVGGICYRPFFERNFVEIVFLAVDYDFQVKGVGGFMMDLLKEVVKEEAGDCSWKSADSLLGIYEHRGRTIDDLDPLLNRTLENSPLPLYLVTYADNFAIGYFRKQGFSTDVRFGGWIGFIKDYEGGTVVECCVSWEINYLKKQEIIESMRRKLFEEMKGINNYHITHKIEDYSRIKEIGDIPGVSGVECIVEEDRGMRLQARFISYLISDLQSNAHAWPFLRPVDPAEVPDYYKCIAKPMDLSTMVLKLRNNEYGCIEAFVADVHLMVNNCFEYNGRDTQYYKCAQALLDHFNKKLEFYRHVVGRLSTKRGAD
ncbi:TRANSCRIPTIONAL ACTIVATOR [Encephalitozoon cuniculi GB-M1]|uniref:histone acetyltransferase n=1 Tax=Encephalitozoon cuniculi (strain GB-M1) TaxID=284813 RepID=Q8SR12_ENCCU|nr:transcriptional activator [Encephalitozoon cuniculi GB-M1]UYI26605.1 histone acetyltransferase [Encephalitozoon cuniculi]CAD25862.1 TRANSCRIPTIONAL ACTIVATOR [Encephalitozoon cuniculi GB-M1]